MCLAAIRFSPSSSKKYKVILAFNRDEFFARPNKKLSWNESGDVLGGWDMEPGREGGSWLVMSRSGKISALTNVLTAVLKPNKIPRGRLVLNFCEGQDSPREYFEGLELGEFNPFNLLLVDVANDRCFSFNNTKAELVDLADGKCHVLSNALQVDSDWLKSQSLMKSFEKEVEKDLLEEELIDRLLNVLKDAHCCGEDPAITQQSQGVIEKMIGMETYSAVMIAGSEAEKAGYGTRTHSVLLIDQKNDVTFVEVDRNSPKDWTKTVEKFRIRV